MTTQHLVLSDPKGKFWEGALVETAQANILHQSGVVTIPVVPSLFLRNGCAGFMKRAWGAGWKLADVVPTRVCPLILYSVPAYSYVHWRARLVREDKEPPCGTLRIVSDSVQVNANLGGLVATETTVVDLTKLGEADAEGGWNVGGYGRISTQVEGYMGLALWGSGTGVRVVWAAVSQA